MLTQFPARAGSVRVHPDQRQWLTARQKGAIKRQVSREFDVYTSRIVEWMLYHWVPSAGCCDPALSTIAEGSGVGLTTVKDRLPKLAAAGILRVVNRGIAGLRRWVQWTNAYLFAVPEDAGKSLQGCEAAARPPDTIKEKERLRREDQRKAAPPPVLPQPPAGDPMEAMRQRRAAALAEADLQRRRHRWGLGPPQVPR